MATIDEFLMARYAEEREAGKDEADLNSKRVIVTRCQEAMLTIGPGAAPLVHFAKQTLWDLARPYQEHTEHRGDDWKWEMR